VGYVRERIGNRPYDDPLTILTYIAANTERIALGTSVLVLPDHHPMRLAKAAATLDITTPRKAGKSPVTAALRLDKGPSFEYRTRST
jgi:alkanesulfonate monooxygenase SsuD/methylene tetrahydromethanopterin reductase-like flavin-dependent oxidoreductase (luciferase family)